MSDGEPGGGLLEPGASIIRLKAGNKRSGEPVFEQVQTRLASDGTRLLLHTPGLVLGVAAGDVIEADPSGETFRVVLRGGNIAVHVYGPPDVALSVEPQIRDLGGWHDGGVKNRLAIFTVPAQEGRVFERLAAVLNSLPNGIEWYYGNVYGDDGVTPLGWWE